MSKFANICFWLAMTYVGLIVQMFIPRIDALVPEIIYLLQEKSYKTLIWLMPIIILLQEGLGTRPFGGSIVWYTIIYLIYRLGERFFTSDTFVFVFFLSAACGSAYYGFNVLLAPLQDLEVDSQLLMDLSFLQAIYVPFALYICKYLRREVKIGEE